MFLIQFDACNRELQNIASIGYVLYYDSTVIWKHCSILKESYNSNYAEYKALIYALKFALSLNIKYLQVEGDAKIVIDQIKDLCNTKSPSVQPLLEEVKQLKSKFNEIEFEHIYRDKNILADSLANQALYDYQINLVS
tara:strand:+ start:1782 stop:2195 length:414 start_codon:yes stop_codon:yes gene_type:complete